MELENFKGEIKRNEPLSRHTSFAIGGPADILAYPADRDDLITLLREINKRRLYFISAAAPTCSCATAAFAACGHPGAHGSHPDRARVPVRGRRVRSGLCRGGSPAQASFICHRSGLTGLEFAGGILGTVGGAVHECRHGRGEFGDIVESVTLVTPDGE
jgi:UDP-N-acetylmuramate dehydrogenase